MLKSRRLGFVFLLCLLSVIAAIVLWPKPNPPIVSTKPECPEGGDYRTMLLTWHGDTVVRDSTGIAKPPNTPHAAQIGYGELALSKPITNVVEFHDCQRLIAKEKNSDRLTYLSLFAIFARARLDRPYAPSGREIRVGGLPFDAQTMGIPMATIFSYEDSYRWLHLKPGFNCLYFFRNDVGGALGWKAKVIWADSNEARCATPLPASENSGKMLIVDRLVRAKSIRSPNDYPPVARWDWDATDSLQYIGIRCEDAWCEVRPDAPGGHFASSGELSIPDSRLRVKGWYDQQLLDDPSSVTPVPTDMLGTFIPAADLGDAQMVETDPNPFTHTWKAVATIGINKFPGNYVSKLNIVADIKNVPQNHLELCQSTQTDAADCADIPEAVHGKCPTSSWFARIYHGEPPQTDKPRYFCIIRRPHDMIGVMDTSGGVTMMKSGPIPGTVRWRWVLKDETMWVRCLQGCCEVRQL